MIFELQLLNLAAFDFETYRKSFEHGLSIDKKRFVKVFDKKLNKNQGSLISLL